MKFLVKTSFCLILLIAATHSTEEPDKDRQPQYTFSYNVHDSLTGDSKSQVETRNGDVVLGQYSLDDPDGTRRTVDYKADAVNGFNAVVRRSPIIRGVALVEPKVAVASQSLSQYPDPKSVAPSYISMPYPVAQLLFLRAHVPESWFMNVVPHFYLY
ncbi:larval cuticle protein A2B-like [Coccinella septempunctata]|uniref:larval cuticle protein A2B-like n=1 Tax=Coccinella septempunctata TaxID=41139 RepID=UPI001D064587|nr:larval cuticle protein A2B-like [Coccinella septempunctata]